MKFTRTDLSTHAPSPKTSNDYNGGGGGLTADAPSPAPHAPETIARWREMLRATGPTDDRPTGITPPEIAERAATALSAMDDPGELAADFFGQDALREGFDIESRLRADRPPAPAPLPTEEQRTGLARLALDRVALDPEDAAALAAIEKGKS